MERIRYGVIGLHFGQYHVRTLANMADVKLVAVAEQHPSMPESLDDYAHHYGTSAYTNGIQMMEDENLDAVSLCVPPLARPKLIKVAARKGIALFIEKPWAANLHQARQLADLCQPIGSRVMVAFSFRFLPAIVKLGELLTGQLGPGLLVNADYTFSWRPPAGHWLWDPANGNGFFNENSCHLFDSLNYLLGEPVSVMAEGNSFLGSPGEDGAVVIIRYASGALVALTCGGIGARARSNYPRIDLVTEHGQAQLIGRNHIWESVNWSLRTDNILQTIEAPAEVDGKTRYTYALQHFINCLRDKCKPSLTIQDGVNSVRLTMAIYHAMRSHQAVLLQDVM